MKIYKIRHPKNIHETKYFASEELMLNFFKKIFSKEIKETEKECPIGLGIKIDLEIIKSHKAIVTFEKWCEHGKEHKLRGDIKGYRSYWTYETINVIE